MLSSCGTRKDPVPLRVADVGEAAGDAVDLHRAIVIADHAGQDLHQRRFAGAVLARHGVNVARLEGHSTRRAAHALRRTFCPHPMTFAAGARAVVDMIRGSS